jgi:hypothetical protein
VLGLFAPWANDPAHISRNYCGDLTFLWSFSFADCRCASKLKFIESLR